MYKESEPYTGVCWCYHPKTRSQQQISTTRIQTRSSSLPQAVNPKAGQHHKQAPRYQEKQMYIQSGLKDLTNSLVLPDIIVKWRRGNVSFLPWWNVRGKCGRRLRGPRFGRGRWRWLCGRRGRGRRRSTRRRRLLQPCQSLHADLGKHQLENIDYCMDMGDGGDTYAVSIIGGISQGLA
jgi:hypothetical protein